MTENEKLVCPYCGNEHLYSTQKTLVDYPVLMSRDLNGEIVLDHDDGRDRFVNDEGSTHEGDLYCKGCGTEIRDTDLVTAKTYAHRDTQVITVEEDSDRGSDIRWAAFCDASNDGWACDWAGLWYHADQFVDAALAIEGSDPGQLAWEAANDEGKAHLASFGVTD